jgi:aspartyl-tRNA(Asn)/glutamyl-tRNA(Gln) amidotransferase subunit B
VKLVEDGTLSGKLAKDVFGRCGPSGRRAADIVAKEGLAQVSDGGALEAACRKVIEAHPTEASNFKSNPKLADLALSRGCSSCVRRGVRCCA